MLFKILWLIPWYRARWMKRHNDAVLAGTDIKKAAWEQRDADISEAWRT